MKLSLSDLAKEAAEVASLGPDYYEGDMLRDFHVRVAAALAQQAQPKATPDHHTTECYASGDTRYCNGAHEMHDDFPAQQAQPLTDEIIARQVMLMVPESNSDPVAPHLRDMLVDIACWARERMAQHHALIEVMREGEHATLVAQIKALPISVPLYTHEDYVKRADVLALIDEAQQAQPEMPTLEQVAALRRGLPPTQDVASIQYLTAWNAAIDAVLALFAPREATIAKCDICGFAHATDLCGAPLNKQRK